MARGWFKWAAGLGLGAALSVGTQLQLAQVAPPDLDVNLLFVPPAKLTQALATGNENVIADGLWLSVLQYYGDRLALTDKHCVNLIEMFELITDLDPQFSFAYWLGGWAIAENGDPAAAVRLLQKAERHMPTVHDYPYWTAFIQYLYQHDPASAARSFERAAALPGAPRFARSMAARMYEQTGSDEFALSIWRTLEKNSADKPTREIAKRNVERILADRAAGRPSAFIRYRKLPQNVQPLLPGRGVPAE